jgi:hypothetical protein
VVTTDAVAPVSSVRRPVGRVPGPSRRVRLPWLAAAVGLTVLVTALVLWGLGRVADRREVVMVTSPVAEGDPIPAAALGSTQIAVDSASTQLFSAGQRGELVGRIAAVDLAAGDLVGPSMISVLAQVPDGWSEIGGLLKAGRFPVSLSVGDRLVAVPLEGTDQGVEVMVVESSVGDDRALTAVLAAPPDSATRVAQWAAGDNLVLVRVSS